MFNEFNDVRIMCKCMKKLIKQENKIHFLYRLNFFLKLVVFSLKNT